MENPKDCRIAKGLTQMQLAVAAGVSIPTIYRCEALGVWPTNAVVRGRYRRGLGLDQSAATNEQPAATNA